MKWGGARCRPEGPHRIVETVEWVEDIRQEAWVLDPPGTSPRIWRNMRWAWQQVTACADCKMLLNICWRDDFLPRAQPVTPGSPPPGVAR